MPESRDIGSFLQEQFSSGEGLAPVDGSPVQEEASSQGATENIETPTPTDGGGQAEPQNEPAGTPPTSNPPHDAPVAQEPKGGVEEEKKTVNFFGSESSSEKGTGNTEISDQAVLSYLSEKLGTNIESIDGLASALQKDGSDVFADEQIKAINDFVKQTGRSASDWYATQAQDYSSMSEEDIVKLRIKSEAPDLTSQEVQSIFEKEYAQGDDYDESDVMYGKAKLKRDAGKFRQEFNEIKQRYATEKVETLPAQDAAQKASITEQITGSSEKFFEQLNSEMNDVEAITFGEGDDAFEFAITDEYKQQFAQQISSSPENPFSRYYDDKGNFDVGQYFMHQALLDNMEQLVNAARSTAKSEATENLVKNAKNSNLDTIPQNQGGEPKLTIQEQAAKVILGT